MLFIVFSILHIAQAEPQLQQIFPAVSTSLQDDATTIWTNPANFSFSPKASRAYLARFSETRNSFVTARQLGILGTGLHYSNDINVGNWWSFATGLSIPLDKHLSFGTTSTWHSIDSAENNFFSWDLGLGYRPLQWLGFGASWNNLGSKTTTQITEAVSLSSGISILDARLQLGVDYISDPTKITEDLGEFRYTLRTYPLKGLSILLQGTDTNEVGVGLNLGHGYGTIGGFSTFGDEISHSIVGTTGVDDTSIFARGRRVAYFDIKKPIPYQSSSSLFSEPTETYFSFYHRVHKASTDPAIKGLVFHIHNLSFSLAQLQELRREIEEAKRRGKKVLVYLEGSPGNGEYYFASAASKVYLHPAGSLELTGLQSERMYYKGLFDQLGITAEFVRRSDYKSAPEQYTHTGGSEASKEQSKDLLDSIYQHLTTEIGKRRSLPNTTVATLIDSAPFTAKQALDKGFVDALTYRDEFKASLDTEFGDFHRIEKNYGNQPPSGWKNNSEIALIPITGVIMPGDSQAPGLLGGAFNAGADTIVTQLEEAADDSAVKAIVIRVDSPGGSAFASDQIWRAVELAKKEKPVIVSMGGMAASGGYYVSAPADTIFAENTTITGSIGVYSGKFNVSGLAAMLSVNIETEQRGKNASIYSSFVPWNEAQRAKMEEQVEETYIRFKTVVSEGRGLTMEQVEQVAQGHVWSGEKAKEIGLVDNLGGLFEAIEFATQKADINAAGLTLVQYQVGNANSVYKFEVTMQELLQNPLERDLSFLDALSREHCWLIEPTFRVY